MYVCMCVQALLHISVGNLQLMVRPNCFLNDAHHQCKDTTTMAVFLPATGYSDLCPCLHGQAQH